MNGCLHGYVDVVSYKLNFFEKNARGGRNPWSSRHAGIYHHHKSDSDLFIILNCVRQTSFRKNLQTLIQSGATSGQPGRLSGIAHNPELLHVMLLHDYFDNWKYYLDTLGTKFEKIVSP